jgi:cytochrome c6
MKRIVVVVSLIVAISLILTISSFQAGAKERSGKDLFQTFCEVCHPDGGNKYFPEYTLHRKDLEANGFDTAEAIVGKMRNPGALSPHANKLSVMRKFDEKTLSDKDAYKIAEYVLNNFK